MYSVLIFNKRTSEDFRTYRPLFRDRIRAGEIDLCEWTEEAPKVEDNLASQNSVLTNLQDIYKKVGDKKEWRAIIVQSYLGDEEGPLAVDRRNPFDYLIYQRAYKDEQKAAKEQHREERELYMTQESPIPLVRLTQMLGGVPTPTTQYIETAREDWELDERTQKQKRTIEAVHSEEARRLYEDLTQQYHFAANPPSEILLIAVRPKQEESLDRVKQSWANYDELQSSLFWSYNYYASKCRFLTFEMEKKGENQRQGDLLRLWLAVGLLATNPLDPSTFQANHLYTIRINIDREILSDVFHDSALKLVSAGRYLNKSIDQDHQRYLNERIDPPEYNVNVEVVAENNRLGRIQVPLDAYGLTAQESNADMDTWNHDREEVDENIAKLRRLIGRAVENSAHRMRGNCLYDEEQVYPLSDFQAKEFAEQLKETYQDVLDEQVLLPFADITELQERKKAAKSRVDLRIRGRMTPGKVITGYMLTSVVTLISVLPSIIRAYTTQTSVLVPILASLCASALIYFIALVAVVIYQHKELNDFLNSYNNLINEIREKIDINANAYGNFLSSVGSHMKGSSYLNILRHKVFRREDIIQQKRHHLDEINKFKQTLEVWARAVYIPCDFEMAGEEDQIDFDEDDIPNFDTLYTLESDKAYPVTMNNLGPCLRSSFSFIESLQVIREELYDDDIFSA